MGHLILLLSLLLLSGTLAEEDGKRPAIQPFFSCWYQHGVEHDVNGSSATTTTAITTGKQVLNLVFGYNNTHKVGRAIARDSETNVLLPDKFGTPQPFVFEVGHHPFAFVVKDVTSQLIPYENRIQWKLGSKNVSISRKDIRASNRCATHFKNMCPPLITHFCDDGIFCNGEEECVITAKGFYGNCRPGKTVACKEGQSCDNKKRICTSDTTVVTQPLVVRKNITKTATPKSLSGKKKNSTKTTSSSSSKPLTTSRKKKNITKITTKTLTIDNKKKKKETPVLQEGKDIIKKKITKEVVLEKKPLVQRKDITDTGDVACVSDADCASIHTYCDGQFTCDTEQGICFPANESYTPCGNSYSALSLFYSNNAEYQLYGFPISIHCVEESQLCVQLFSCVTDDDCSDNLTCNGIEHCIEGTCAFQQDQSIEAICGTTLSAECTEELGCVVDGDVPTEAPTAAPTAAPTYTIPIIIGVILAVIILLGAIIILVLIYRDFTTGDDLYMTYNSAGMKTGTTSASASAYSTYNSAPLYFSNNNNVNTKYGMSLRPGKEHVQ